MVTVTLRSWRPGRSRLTGSFVFVELPRVGDRISVCDEDGNFNFLQVTQVIHKPRSLVLPANNQFAFENPERYLAGLPEPSAHLDCELIEIIEAESEPASSE
jgi:hypothetical protein